MQPSGLIVLAAKPNYGTLNKCMNGASMRMVPTEQAQLPRRFVDALTLTTMRPVCPSFPAPNSMQYCQV